MDRITQLKKENKWLKEEIRRLRHQLAEVKKEEWAHPELNDVKVGDPLLVVKFTEEDLQELQRRDTKTEVSVISERGKRMGTSRIMFA